MEPAERQRAEAEAPTAVLVVDDDEGIRKLLAKILRMTEDFVVYEARDGIEAQPLLEAHEIDVAIIDLLMPRMDGLSLMAWGRDAGVEVAWIILSGRGTFSDAVKAVQFGVYDFITKPLSSPESLLVRVRNAARHRRMEKERRRLLSSLESTNAQLRKQIEQLQEAHRLLTRQQETINEDLHRAELIQRALLPFSPPPIGDFAVDAIYRPSSDVGGDLYDVVRVDDRHVVAYVADAAGHGVSAAMLAVLLKQRIGMVDAETRHPIAPATALNRANSHILHECRAPGLFITAAYCLLDTDTREVTVASAGHTPLIVLRHDGSREMIYHTGPALGLSTDAMYSQKTLYMESDDRLLLYTDGLYDLADPADPAPNESIADTLASLSGDGWEQLHQVLHLAAERRGDEPQQDDMTALLLTAGRTTSSIDNGEPARSASAATPVASSADVLIGGEPDHTMICVRGRGTWMHCAALQEAWGRIRRGGGGVVIDLSLCEHLDSTFLGTLQEMCARADREKLDLRIQNVLPEVRRLFEELGMHRVIKRFSSQSQPPPPSMKPLTSCMDDNLNRERMLLAHQALAGLSDANRQQFTTLIEHLRAEIEKLSGQNE